MNKRLHVHIKNNRGGEEIFRTTPALWRQARARHPEVASDVRATIGWDLDRTGIADRARDSLAGLSKGLAQRVGFAQAFLGRPELLLLDEPTSGLDPIGVRDARDWIRTARERGCTILVSSHVLSEVERICDRVAIMHEGRIAASGAIDDLVRPDENLEDAFVRVVRG